MNLYIRKTDVARWFCLDREEAESLVNLVKLSYSGMGRKVVDAFAMQAPGGQWMTEVRWIEHIDI